MTSFSVRGWRLVLRLAFAAGVVSSSQAACSSSPDQGLRRCRDSFNAYIPNADSTCGKQVSVPVSYCERLTSTCDSQKPVTTCVESPDLRGYLMILDPCATLESIPEGWSLATQLSVGSRAAPDCIAAARTCGAGGTGGSGGSAGSGGTGGSGGTAGTGGTSGSGGTAGLGGTAGKGGTAGVGGSAGTP